MSFDVRPGTIADAAAALDIWRAAASFWIAAGRPLWTVAQFTLGRIETAAQAGQLVIGLEAGEIVACMLVEDKDQLMWRESEPGAALYLHKLAAKCTGSRNWAPRLVGWAALEAGRRGIDRLRLDCTDRPELIRIYDGCGFSHVDDAPLLLGGVLNHRMERRL